MSWSHLARTVFADGPAGMPNQPAKSEIRQLLKQYEDAIAALTQSIGAALTKASKADIDAVAGDYENGDIAIVFADATEALRGVYKLTGGVWVKQYDLPSDLAQLAADAALASSDEAKAARDEAVPAAVTATVQAGNALASAVVAAGYAAAAGISNVFTTKAEANAALSGVAANAFVKVLVDESQAGVETVYQKVSGAYVLKVKSGRKNVYLEDFGGIGNNVANDSAAFTSAKAWLLANGGTLRLTGGKTFYLGSAAIDLSGIRIVAEKGSGVRGNIDLTQENFDVPEDLDIKVDSAGIVYLFKTPRGYRKPYAERTLWLDKGLTRDRYEYIDAGTFIKDSVSTTGDTFGTDTLPVAVPDTISWALTSGDTATWHGAYLPMYGGQEIQAVFSDRTANFTRAVIVRWLGGYFGVYAALGQATFFSKTIGNSLVTTPLNWDGETDHPQWLPANSEWGVRVYDNSYVGFLINGTEVYRTSIGSGSIITSAGFAVRGNGSALTAAVTRISRRTSGDFGGQNPLSIAIFADSNASPIVGNWPDAMREALDATLGIRVSEIINKAVSGQTTSDQLAIMNADGLGAANYVVIWLGSNNIQQGSPLSATMSDMIAMLDKINSEGRRPVVCIQPLSLSAGQGPGGFSPANTEKGAETRAAIRSLAAKKGAVIVDINQLIGPILTRYYDTATYNVISDTRVKDRIHMTPFMNRVIGRAIASSIGGDYARVPTRKIPEMGLPIPMFRNGWSSGTGSELVLIAVDTEGVLSLGGVIYKGTTFSDGTAIIRLPVNLRPKVSDRRFLVRGNDGTIVTIVVTTGGDMQVYSLGTATNVDISSIRFHI